MGPTDAFRIFYETFQAIYGVQFFMWSIGKDGYGLIKIIYCIIECLYV